MTFIYIYILACANLFGCLAVLTCANLCLSHLAAAAVKDIGKVR